MGIPRVGRDVPERVGGEHNPPADPERCSGTSATKTPVTTTNDTAKGTYTITVTATNGTLSHTVPLTLVVQ